MSSIVTIIPMVGIFTGLAVSLAPMREIIHTRQGRRSIHQNNPIPSTLLFSNSLGWVFYSFVTHQKLVFLARISGVVLAIFYFLTMYGMWTAEMMAKRRAVPPIPAEINQCQAKRRFILWTLLIGCSFVMLGAYIAFQQDVYANSKSIMGTFCLISHSCFLLSPFSSIQKVIKDKNAATINILLSMALFTNGFLWMSYGIVLRDLTHFAPNVIGVLLAMLQIFLKIYFPSGAKAPQKLNDGSAAPETVAINDAELMKQAAHAPTPVAQEIQMENLTDVSDGIGEDEDEDGSMESLK